MSLCLKNLTIYDKKNSQLFPPIDIEIGSGEVLSLMGPSGCGKSTLLSAIAGHLADEFTAEGSILLNDLPIEGVPAHRREVGMLFQDDLLFPHFCVWENLAFALPDSVKGSERHEMAIQALEKVNLSALANSMPDQISGGQRARISLVRMLLARPKLVLLDEPFSKLDKKLREQFRDWVFSQIKQAGIPALLVTHDESDIPPDSCSLQWPWSNRSC